MKGKIKHDFVKCYNPTEIPLVNFLTAVSQSQGTDLDLLLSTDLLNGKIFSRNSSSFCLIVYCSRIVDRNDFFIRSSYIVSFALLSLKKFSLTDSVA